MALGDGPLRTKELTARVPGYSARTIYRSASQLASLDVVEREEEPGVPSKVVQSLTDPCGRDLFNLLDSFADAALVRLPDGRLDVHSWALLGLLADLWESGMAEELSCDPRSPTELARAQSGLSYHQVNRRIALFITGGLVRAIPARRQRKRCALTEKTRRAMALVAGLGRWRHRHIASEEEAGLTAPEMGTVLRIALPLVRLPKHTGKGLKLCVSDAEHSSSEESEVIWAEVENDGTVHSCSSALPKADGQASGTVDAWLTAILDGDQDRIEIEDGTAPVGACLRKLHHALWHEAPSPTT